MQVLALVGRSGSGKSHRAIGIAHHYQADTILDDGLLIKETTVIAGKSAKKQSNFISAIKTALFTAPEHAEEVKEALRKLNPQKILILATSRPMANKIAANLSLPAPQTIILIEDIASEEEIKKALQVRQKHGTHVVPAPTIEVKPKLSGILIKPIKTFFSRKHSPHFPAPMWVEQTVVRPTFTLYGKLYIANNVLEEIIYYSLWNTAEISKISRIEINSSPEEVNLEIDLWIKYPFSYLPAILGQAQEAVRQNIEHITALHVNQLNVTAKKIIVDR